MKIAVAVILMLVLAFIGTQIYSSFKEVHSLSAQYASISSQLDQAKAQEASLSAEVNYLADPVNLEKELRARFNYAKPGETMVIIIPSSTASTSAALASSSAVSD
jgi:cell division protein DivIC